MGHGDEFENIIADELENYVGDQGVVLIQTQSMSTRRGKFEGNQETDILVDSGRSLMYLGVEAKTRNAENTTGIYFSQCTDNQFSDMAEYAQRSGRSIFVAVEARHFDKWESHAWITPLSLWAVREKNDETKVSWEQCERFGISIGLNRDYSITAETLQELLLVDKFISDNRVRVKGTGNSPITDDELDYYRDAELEASRLL